MTAYKTNCKDYYRSSCKTELTSMHLPEALAYFYSIVLKIFIRSVYKPDFIITAFTFVRVIGKYSYKKIWWFRPNQLYYNY